MANNLREGAAFIAGGTAAGASVSAIVGGMGLVGGFGPIGIGMAPVAAARGVVGAAAYGAFQAIGEGDATAFGAIGIGVLGGVGFYSAVGGMGLNFGGTAVGIGMGTMGATGDVIRLAAYGIAKLLNKAGSGETPAQAFARMGDKILWKEAYNEALLDSQMAALESSLAKQICQQKLAALEVEEELKALKAQLPRKNLSYFNFSAAKLHQPTFTLFTKPGKPANTSATGENHWECVKTLEGHKGTINCIAISSDNETIASGSDDRTVSLWNLKTGKRIFTFFGLSKEVYSLAISPDGQMLVSGGFENKITRWNLANKGIIGTCFYLNSQNSHLGFVYSVAFSPDGKTLAGASADKTIRIWGCLTGAVKYTLNVHSDAVLSIAISPDGKLLVSGSADKTIRIWNLNTSHTLLILNGHSGWVTAVAITPDGETLISGSTDRTIKLWNLQSGELIRTVYGHSSAIFSVAVSPDGKSFASGSLKEVNLWDLRSGMLLQTLSGCYPVAFSPDGKTLVTGGNSTGIKIWHQSCIGNNSTTEIVLSGEWWQVLGIDKKADFHEVKRAYRLLAMKYHPDINRSATAKANMQAIVEAYKKFRQK